MLCYTAIRFFQGLKAQNIDRSRLPYLSPFQPYTAWFGLISCSIVVFFSGYSAFIGKWSASAFFSNYLNLFLCVAFYIVAKIVLWRSSPWVRASEMDFSELDVIEREREFPVESDTSIPPSNLVKKAWYYVF